MRKLITLPLLIAGAFATLMPVTATAGTLSVSEPRILMTSDNKRDEFKVFNTSSEIQTLRISLIDKQMDESGGIKTVENSASSAADYLRVGPRVGKNINPKGFQKFRVRAKLKKMPVGEYRSHLLVESMNPPKEETKAGIHIKPNIKYSIPIIVRNGELNAQVAISNARMTENTLENGEKQNLLAFDMSREGDRSVYGDFSLYQLQDGNKTLLKTLVGQAIYTDVNKRQFTIELPQSLDLGSELTIEFIENPEFGGDSHTQTTIKV